MVIGASAILVVVGTSAILVEIAILVVQNAVNGLGTNYWEDFRKD